jgi:hypothetical protein
MLAHCSLSMQWAVGEVAPEKGALPARLMGRLVKAYGGPHALHQIFRPGLELGLALGLDQSLWAGESA